MLTFSLGSKPFGEGGFCEPYPSNNPEVTLSSDAIILILFSAVIHVGWNTLLKSSSEPRTFSLLKGSVLVLIALIAAPWIPFKQIPDSLWIFCLISGIVHTVYIIALSSAYTTGDISFVYPIVRSSPALVPVAAYFLIGERLSAQGIAGIIVVVGCILLLQKRPPGTQESNTKDRLLQKDLLWALLTLATVVSYTIVDKAGMVVFRDAEEIPSIWRGPIYFMLENAICYAFFWLYTAVRGFPEVGILIRTEGKQVVAAAIGTILSYSLILHVLQTEAASYVVTLRQSSVLMAVLAGIFYFKERQAAYRIAIAVVMLIGFYLVSTA